MYATLKFDTEDVYFPPEFSCDKIAEHARLQTWTLKPAWLRPPRGASLPEGRIPFPARA